MHYYLLTLGCPKNAVDSETMSELLRLLGHIEVSVPQDADLLIVNTCGFLDAARQEALTELRQLAAAKRSDQILVAAGCLAQRDGSDLYRQVPDIDALLGTRRWMEIGTLLQELRALRDRQPRLSLLDDPSPTANTVRNRPPATSGSAYLKISDGCDATCAFCTIPSIKGRLKSRPLGALLDEAQGLVASGARELILIGQDSTSYGRDLGLVDGLTHLMEALLAALPDLSWLRLMYAYPGHVSGQLIEVMALDPRVCHYLDLPLQHGHPETLRRMRRPADVKRTLSLVGRLRSAMPDIALRSTFIVGFPGETEEEFQGLLEFAEAIQFDKVGVFEFSAEPGTIAADMPDQVPGEVRRRRHDQLMALQQRISRERNQAQVGRQLNVLVEGVGDGLTVGRSYRDAPQVDGLVLISGELPLARMTPVNITGAMEYDLIGETP
jgi:ribosomal protein S12 methylthiotransferase